MVILCSCAVIRQDELRQVIRELHKKNPSAPMTPNRVYKALGKTPTCMACAPPAVRIGSELPVDELSPFAMVASTYGASGESLGSLGLLGPTRMDYGQAMSTVRAVATSLERALAALTGTGTSDT